MLAAGCAVGLGNVWRFPFVVGQNGGAAFVIVYLAFLVLFGLPLLVAELAVGRGAKKGIAGAMGALGNAAKVPRSVWRTIGFVIFAGNFVLMIYYTDVAGWLVKYTGDYLVGRTTAFPDLLADKATCARYMALTVAVAAAICFAGVVKGVERITKFLMLSLLALLGVLAAKALTLPAAAEGLRFYLYPDWGRFAANAGRAVMEAMGQAFFTLSIGVGCMTIFGSYIQRERSLVTEAIWIILIDTAVAFLAGLVIFPACLSYGVEPSSGPGLIFIALPEVFARMPSGRVWGFCFFLFLAFAALTTIIAVFECIIGGLVDESRGRRRVIAPLVGAAVALASLPCVLWDGVLDGEDFAVSQVWLPVGALVLCLFATRSWGWGVDAFRAEASAGAGLRLPAWCGLYMRWILPLLLTGVLAIGIKSAIT